MSELGVGFPLFFDLRKFLIFLNLLMLVIVGLYACGENLYRSKYMIRLDNEELFKLPFLFRILSIGSHGTQLLDDSFFTQNILHVIVILLILVVSNLYRAR